MLKKNPFILVILDGWGINKPYNGNAITQAKTPVYDLLWQNFPHTKLTAHGRAVGLPPTQDGNSESGYLNLGAGRIIDQDTVIISKAINSGIFFKNTALKETVEHIKKNNSRVHLMGLLSGWQSAHSDPDHILALLIFYRKYGIKNIYLHLFTDGRDSFKYGALKFLKNLKKQMKNNEKIATIMGRYYAMDRKKKWEHTEMAYDLLTGSKADFHAKNGEEAIQSAYDRGETDEFILPTIVDGTTGCIRDNDAIVFFNLRSDRTRQLTKAFVQLDFNKKNTGSFKRKKVLKNLIFIALTDFGPDLDSILSVFPSEDIKNALPTVLKDLRQLYITENEKYAHVTYFFNGGYANPQGGEDRLMIPSVDVSRYDLKPAMSAFEISDKILGFLNKNKYDFITVNYANPDMVGHTGNLAAGIQACEIVDKCLENLVNKIKEKQGVLIVTADHGNIEEMIDEKTGQVDTQHSNYPVPFIIADFRNIKIKNKKYKLKSSGILGNVAPTILDLMNRKKPKEMKEESLIIK